MVLNDGREGGGGKEGECGWRDGRGGREGEVGGGTKVGLPWLG